jgi:hypothetical protein
MGHVLTHAAQQILEAHHHPSHRRGIVSALGAGDDPFAARVKSGIDYMRRCEFITLLGGRQEASYDPCQPNIKIRRKVLTRLASLRAQLLPPLPARHSEPVDTSTSHFGFRCIKRKGMTS